MTHAIEILDDGLFVYADRDIVNNAIEFIFDQRPYEEKPQRYVVKSATLKMLIEKHISETKTQ